jgi:hypothetical protein
VVRLRQARPGLVPRAARRGRRRRRENPPRHLVAERLAALREEHLSAVLSALYLVIESGTRPWFVVGARDEIETVLVASLAANG